MVLGWIWLDIDMLNRMVLPGIDNVMSGFCQVLTHVEAAKEWYDAEEYHQKYEEKQRRAATR